MRMLNVPENEMKQAKKRTTSRTIARAEDKYLGSEKLQI